MFGAKIYYKHYTRFRVVRDTGSTCFIFVIIRRLLWHTPSNLLILSTPYLQNDDISIAYVKIEDGNFAVEH